MTKDTYFLMEKLQSMTKDYTIDYEEYWNRQQVWCMEMWRTESGPWWSPSRNMSGNCTQFTNYGNQNMNLYWDSIFSDPRRGAYHTLYYCSSIEDWLHQYEDWNPQAVVLDITDTNSLHRMNCIRAGRGRNHSYGQYAQMFIDVKDDVDYVPWAANDDDDEDRGNWPEAIYNSGWNNPQEIYLISHDKQRRMLIRRVLKNAAEVNNWTADLNSDGIISNSEKFYTLQVLQLRWFDAGMSHTFDPTDQWVLDGKIDTWACDASLWFECEWESIQWAYPEYHLPADNDDGWVDLLSADITISDWDIQIYPLKDPELAWNDPSTQHSPYMVISLVSQLYAKNRKRKLTIDQMNAYTLPLQTQFSFSVQ